MSLDIFSVTLLPHVNMTFLVMLAAGKHSEARAAASEATAARGAALRAHAAAATAIERANNQARGLPADTLDLHGLHIGEALGALERRRAHTTHRV